MCSSTTFYSKHACIAELPCKTCGVAAGTPCRTISCWKPTKGPHAARAYAWRDLHNDTWRQTHSFTGRPFRGLNE